MENENIKKRTGFIPMLALLKKNIVSAFDVITTNNVFRFKLDNDKVFYSYLAQLTKKLDDLNSSIVNLPKIELKESPASIQIQTMGAETIKKIVEGLSDLRKSVESNRMFFPKIQEIRGTVDIKNQQYVPYDRLLNSLKSIEDKISRIRIELPVQKQPEIRIPDFPKELSLPEMAKVLDAIKEMKEEISNLPKRMPEVIIPKTISVDNFPPQKYPMPVTNISINALSGTVKSRSVTVTSDLTPLPGEVLANRRSLVIYNNSSSTIEIGGSTFTFGEGMPVPAGNFSPGFDAGDETIIYGRVASGTANVRTLEISDIPVGR